MNELTIGSGDEAFLSMGTLEGGGDFEGGQLHNRGSSKDSMEGSS